MARILLADDDVAYLCMCQAVLEAGGHEVRLATCASMARRSLEQGDTDLVIMDLRFPNADGKPDVREGLAMLRGIREAGYVAPVILFSGWPDDLIGQPEERMVSLVLVKPVPMRVLLEAIEKLVGKPRP